MSRIQEGEAHLNEAAKSLKTTLLRWKPDFDIAGTEYEKAANCFKSAKALDRALESFLQAADCYKKSNQPFAAAKCYEQAGTILYKDFQKGEEAFQYFDRACLEFRENGTPDTAALCYDRAAKMIESKHPEKAATYYLLASDTVMIEDRPQHACEYACKSAKLLVKLEKYKEAVETLKKTMNLHLAFKDELSCGKYVIFIILIQLKLDDVVTVSKTYQEGKQYLDGEMMFIMSKIVDAFDKQDSKAIVSALDNTFIKNLDIEYSKIARSIIEVHKEKSKLIEEKIANQEITDEDLEAGLLL